MPSTRRQINVRKFSEESETRLKGLVERMRAILGIQAECESGRDSGRAR